MTDCFETCIKPRFCETDMRGHISNTTVPVWLDEGRVEFFRAHLHCQVPVMVVNLNTDFHRELHWGSPVAVRTRIERIGNSSITFHQQVWQRELRCVSASTTVVAVDLDTRRATRVPDEDRERMASYLIST